MYKTLALLLLVGCSTPQVKPVDEFVGAMQEVSSTKAVLKAAVVEKDALPVAAVVGISPVTAEPFLGWIKTSVGFPKGARDQVNSLGPSGLPYSWRVLKKWDDGSVRIAQLKMPAFFNGLGARPVELYEGMAPKPGFNWHPALWDAVANLKFQNELKLTTSVNGVAVECRPASGQFKFLVVDQTEVVVRFRSHCQSAQGPHALSLTSYFTMFSDDPVVRIQNVIGNDTREFAVGQMNLGPVVVDGGSLPAMRWVNLSAYGNKSVTLADGQQMSFKLVVALDPAFNTTASHIASGEPMGFQEYEGARRSLAFGTAPLPASRVPQAELANVHAQVSAAAVIPTAQARDYLSMINSNPGATGSQPDFASTAPIAIQKAMQVYSAKQMALVMLAVNRESFRPSYLWETRNGVEEWMSNVNYPDGFYWSGRIHYDYSWNGQYPNWQSRTGAFQKGDTGPWNSMDNQHMGNNHLRYAYELTGDPVLEGWLRYKVSEVHWDYFTDWLPNIEAERAFGRTMKEAVALTELLEGPDVNLLKSRIPTKLQNYRNAVTATVNLFGNPAASPFDARDGRVVGGQWATAQNNFGRGNFVAVGWMQGFVHEAMGLLENPDLRVLAAAELYFLADGTPKTYFQLPNPEVYELGGIGIEWQTGTVQLAMKYPNAPGAQYILTRFKPLLDARFQNGCGFPSPYFCLNDNFKNY